MLLLGATAFDGSASAQAPPPRVADHAFALVVGSDHGAEGQAPLRYAESDAQSVRAALVGVGRFRAPDVTLLRGPTAAEVEAALSTIAARIEQHRALGETTELVFYYSGHAQAQSLRLEGGELALARLRARFTAIGADFTLVILDACQSGAYGRTRGAEPAADFSFNSVAQLRVRGAAIMASSTDDELSQESETLRGGFFTHHLVAGLRGAADADGDGRVTLDEVYRYAYDRTLADTSRTAVGGQHATLETELTGQGGVVLGYPAGAGAHLRIPSRLAGRVLIQHMRSGAVVAEIEKTRGQPMQLALPPGRYGVLVRQVRTLHECSVSLRRGDAIDLDTDGCDALDPSTDVQPRGDGKGPLRGRFGVELSAGFAIARDDALVRRIHEFGFDDELLGPGRVSLAVEGRLPRAMSYVVRALMLDYPEYQQGGGAAPVDTYRFRTLGLTAGLRATNLRREGRVALYAEVSLGLGFAYTVFETEGQAAVKSADFGAVLGGAAGFRFMPWERFGFLMETGYTFAPIVNDRIGDVHDSGGLTFLFGFRGEARP